MCVHFTLAYGGDDAHSKNKANGSAATFERKHDACEQEPPREIEDDFVVPDSCRATGDATSTQ